MIYSRNVEDNLFNTSVIKVKYLFIEEYTQFNQITLKVFRGEYILAITKSTAAYVTGIKLARPLGELPRMASESALPADQDPIAGIVDAIRRVTRTERRAIGGVGQVGGVERDLAGTIEPMHAHAR